MHQRVYIVKILIPSFHRFHDNKKKPFYLYTCKLKRSFRIDSLFAHWKWNFIIRQGNPSQYLLIHMLCFCNWLLSIPSDIWTVFFPGDKLYKPNNIVTGKKIKTKMSFKWITAICFLTNILNKLFIQRIFTPDTTLYWDIIHCVNKVTDASIQNGAFSFYECEFFSQGSTVKKAPNNSRNEICCVYAGLISGTISSLFCYISKVYCLCIAWCFFFLSKTNVILFLMVCDD